MGWGDEFVNKSFEGDNVDMVKENGLTPYNNMHIHPQIGFKGTSASQ